MYRTIASLSPGDVLVFASGGTVENLMGDNIATFAELHGLAATVTDSTVRDSAGMAELAMPVYARGTAVRLPLNLEPIALGLGVTQRQIDCIEQGKYDDAAFNAAEQALLAFGREVIDNVRVAEPVFAAMRKHFNEQEIVESILAIGFYMTMARLTEATDVDLDPAAGMTVFEGGRRRPG